MSAPTMCSHVAPADGAPCPRGADVQILVRNRETRQLGRMAMCEPHAHAWIDADTEIVTMTRIAKETPA